MDEIVRTCEQLAIIGQTQRALRDGRSEERFTALERTHEALRRLSLVSTVAELLPAASEQLAGALGFDRTVISRRRGNTWRAEAVWIREGLDPVVSAATEHYLRTTWVPIARDAIEQNLIVRGEADLVLVDGETASAGHLSVSGTRGYVAAPVMPGGRVIGFVQADCVGRVVTELDRDNLQTFVHGFGLVFERAVLLERLSVQRSHLRVTLKDAADSLDALAEEERLRDRRAPAAADAPVAEALPPLIRSPTTDLLTERQCDVLVLMAAGARNAEIAGRLAVSETTVKSHVKSICRRLSTTSRAGAVARYLNGAA